MKSPIVYLPSVLVLILLAMMVHMHASGSDASKLTAERHPQDASAVCTCK